MSSRLPESTRANTKRLRGSLTDAEERLWYHLRRHAMAGHKFRRQHPLGPYIVDFYCAKARLVIEVDGGQHIEGEQAIRDIERTRYLEGRGLRVLRFTNLEVLQETEAVLDRIFEALGGRADPSP